MRILITIPHYYKYDTKSLYGSGTQQAESRVQSFDKMLRAIRNLFNMPQAMLQQEFDEIVGPKLVYRPANTAMNYEVDICVCTTGEDHLLRRLNLPRGYFTMVPVEISSPLYLGYACHQVLKRNLGKYDYYCFMEDDIVLQDSMFFQKLRWFENQFGTECLLQPHLYMTGLHKIFFKEYVDFEFMQYTEKWIDYSKQPHLESEYLGEPLGFFKTRNPHTACFFLSAKQYERMSSREDYAAPLADFSDPMASAASLDIIKTFQIYKSDFSRGAFFEIEHAGKAPSHAAKQVLDREAFAKVGFSFGD